MKQNCYVWSIFILVFTISCQDDVSISTSINLVDVSEKEELLLSNYVGDAKYIKLETSDDCFIGNVQKIRIVSNKIFILDMREAKALYVFNTKGDFLYQIGAKGRGPGEYLYPQDFVIDQDTLYMITDGRRVQKFNIDGTFINQFRLKHHAEQITIDNNELVLIRVNHEAKDVNLLNFYSKDGVPLKQMYKVTLHPCYSESRNHSIKYGGEIFYFTNFEDRLIKVNQLGEIEEALHFVIPTDCKITPERIAQIQKNNEFPLSTTKVLNESFCILNIFHTSEFDYVRYTMRGKCYVALHDRESLRTKVVPCSREINDIDATDIIFHNCQMLNDERIINVIYPDDFTNTKTTSTLFQGYDFKLTDNPIIALYAVKKSD